MSGGVHRLAAVFTVVSASAAIAALATPEASSSPCQALWVWDPTINQMLAPTTSATSNGWPACPSPAVVHTPAPVGTSVGSGVGATTAANPAVGAARQKPGMGPRP